MEIILLLDKSSHGIPLYVPGLSAGEDGVHSEIPGPFRTLDPNDYDHSMHMNPYNDSHGVAPANKASLEMRLLSYEANRLLHSRLARLKRYKNKINSVTLSDPSPELGATSSVSLLKRWTERKPVPHPNTRETTDSRMRGLLESRWTTWKALVQRFQMHFLLMLD